MLNNIEKSDHLSQFLSYNFSIFWPPYRCVSNIDFYVDFAQFLIVVVNLMNVKIASNPGLCGLRLAAI